MAGPGFFKNDFYKYLENKHSDLAKKSILEATGSGGRVGINEVLKKGTVEKLATENRVAFEIAAINEILQEIAKSSPLVVYGKKEVKNPDLWEDLLKYTKKHTVTFIKVKGIFKYIHLSNQTFL